MLAPQERRISNNVPPARSKNESGGVFRRHRSVSTIRLSLELVRNVVEGRTQLRADTLQSGNRGNRDERGNQAVFNRRRTLAVTNQFKELCHFNLLEAVIWPQSPHSSAEAS